MQLSYNYSLGQVGQVGSYATGDVTTVENPLLQQITNYHQDADTTDGTYTIQAVLPGTGFAVSASFVASGDTANAIAVGLADAINADPDFRGVASASTPVGDTFDITFTRAGVAWTVTMTSDPSSGVVDITTSQTAGFTEVALGAILQSDGSGGFTTSYTDAALALGVTLRNAELVQPLQANPGSATGYDGPTEMGVLRRGEVYVQVADGVTVNKGDKAFFNPTAVTWSNATSGSHVLVEGAQWVTGGTGDIQRVYVNLPSES